MCLSLPNSSIVSTVNPPLRIVRKRRANCDLMAARGEIFAAPCDHGSNPSFLRPIIDTQDENSHTFLIFLGDDQSLRARRSLIGRAGFPTQTIIGGRSWRTVLRAPTTVPRPTRTPGLMKTSVAT